MRPRYRFPSGVPSSASGVKFLKTEASSQPPPFLTLRNSFEMIPLSIELENIRADFCCFSSLDSADIFACSRPSSSIEAIRSSIVIRSRAL